MHPEYIFQETEASILLLCDSVCSIFHYKYQLLAVARTLMMPFRGIVINHHFTVIIVPFLRPPPVVIGILLMYTTVLSGRTRLIISVTIRL